MINLPSLNILDMTESEDDYRFLVETTLGCATASTGMAALFTVGATGQADYIRHFGSYAVAGAGLTWTFTTINQKDKPMMIFGKQAKNNHNTDVETQQPKQFMAHSGDKMGEFQEEKPANMVPEKSYTNEKTA